MSPTVTSNIYSLYTSINIKFILSIYQEKINIESNTNIKLVSKYFILIFARYEKKPNTKTRLVCSKVDTSLTLENNIIFKILVKDISKLFQIKVSKPSQHGAWKL